MGHYQLTIRMSDVDGIKSFQSANSREDAHDRVRTQHGGNDNIEEYSCAMDEVDIATSSPSNATHDGG